MTMPAAAPAVAAVPPQSSRSLVGRSLALAVVVVVALVVIAALLSSQNSSRHADSVSGSAYLLGPSARAATAAAETDVTATLTYSYKTLQADFARAERGMTAAFRPSYVQTTNASVVPLATQQRATSTAAVVAAGVSEASPTSVRVLVFVNQTVTNKQLAEPRLDQSRINVTMVLVDGTWLINDLQPV